MNEEGLLDNKDNSFGKSKYHGGFLYIERLDVILKQLGAATYPVNENGQFKQITLNDYARKFYLLQLLFKELSPKMNTETKVKNLEKSYKLEKDFKNCVVQKKPNELVIDAQFNRDFDIWELELRQIMEDKGLLMPMKGDVSSALEG